MRLSFFCRHADYTYIEGRVPCTNLPDNNILTECGAETAESVIISSSALQKGLLINSEEAERLIDETGWEKLVYLRGIALKYGMADSDIKNLCRKALHAAGQGLGAYERQMLAYPFYVLEKGTNGAQEALKLFESMNGSDDERLKAIIQERKFVNPVTNNLKYMIL